MGGATSYYQLAQRYYDADVEYDDDDNDEHDDNDDDNDDDDDDDAALMMTMIHPIAKSPTNIQIH